MMKKFFLILSLLILLCNTVWAAPMQTVTATQTLTLDDFAFQGVRLYDTFDVTIAEKAFGRLLDMERKPPDMPGVNDLYLTHMKFDRGTIIVDVNSKIMFLNVLGSVDENNWLKSTMKQLPAAKTPRKVGLGDRISAILKAYGEPLDLVKTFRYTQYVYLSEDYSAYLIFNVVEGRITEFTISNNLYRK